jgi:hypothetical protein
MHDENSSFGSKAHDFGEVIHRADNKNPMAVGFGSCCCSCSSSAAVFVAEDSVN